MDREEAKIFVIKRALKDMSEGEQNSTWWSHKDLFSTSWFVEKVAQDVAASKTIWKPVMRTLEVLGIIKKIDPSGVRVVIGYECKDVEAAKKMSQDNEALYWLLAPAEFDPPEWVQKRLPAVSSAERTPEDMTGADLIRTILLEVGNRLVEIQASNRRVEDRMNKLDVKSSETRDKTLQLVASAVSDMRQCIAEWRAMSTEAATMIEKAEQRRNDELMVSIDKCDGFTYATVENNDAFLKAIDKKLADLISRLVFDHSELVRSLDMHKRFSDVMEHVQEFKGMMDPIRVMAGTAVKAAESLEAGVELAMDLTKDLEGDDNDTF